MRMSIKCKCVACDEVSFVHETQWVGNESQAQQCFQCTGESAYEISVYKDMQRIASNRRSPNPFDNI